MSLRRVVCVCIALAAAGCNNNNSPSSTTLAGNWLGIIQYTLNGAASQQNISMTLQQQGSNVTGTYTVTSIGIAGYFAAGDWPISGSDAP